MNIRVTKRSIQVAIGILWILDGVLQLQSKMFTASFANNVITPAASGQPIIISGPMHLAVHIILIHPAFFDSVFAIIQLLIGFAILWKKTVLYGLLASIIWGIAVWFGGEGFSGLASGHAILLMGAPGAAIIYSILSLAVLPKTNKKYIDDHPSYWLVFVWSIIWIGGTIFQLLPGQDSVSSISNMILSMSSGAPSWLASLDNNVAKFISDLGQPISSITSSAHSTMYSMPGMSENITTSNQGHSGYWFILFIALVQAFIGLAIYLKGYWRTAALSLGIILAFIFWVVGQSLGSYYSGLATDPNSGPLLILLAVAIFGIKDLDKKLAIFYKKFETLIVGKAN